MSTNDRGMKKWTTMMLPEHKEILKEMWDKQDEPDIPIVDEQRLGDLNKQFVIAYAEKQFVQITYVAGESSDKRSIKCQTGVITNIYPETKRMEVGGVIIDLQLVTDIDVING